ncbi:MAG: hypothetical protein ACJ768_00985 [Gaiellaceae bacterium]
MNAHTGRRAFGLTVAAFAWSLVLVAAALVVPVYSGTTQSGSGPRISTSATLVDVNGTQALLVIAVPALLTAIAGIALHRRCTRGSRQATRLAWVAVYVLAAFGILGAASIGLFVLPVAVLLAAAATLTPAPAD